MAKMKPLIALIVPMYDPSLKPDHTLPGGGSGIGGGAGERPDHTLPGDLPHPEHPIYYPLPPGAPVDPGWSGGVAPPGEEGGAPRPDNTLPGAQPRPDHELPGPQPHPEHPIVLPPDSGNWLPVYIDNTLPGRGSAGGEHPDNALPGAQPRPDHDLPPFPSHPIVLPPHEELPVPPDWGISGTIKFKAIWTPDNGWQTIAVVIPGEGSKPHPTPSGSKKAK
jgi:hypothetical protein